MILISCTQLWFQMSFPHYICGFISGVLLVIVYENLPSNERWFHTKDCDSDSLRYSFKNFFFIFSRVLSIDERIYKSYLREEYEQRKGNETTPTLHSNTRGPQVCHTLCILTRIKQYSPLSDPSRSSDICVSVVYKWYTIFPLSPTRCSFLAKYWSST